MFGKLESIGDPVEQILDRKAQQSVDGFESKIAIACIIGFVFRDISGYIRNHSGGRRGVQYAGWLFDYNQIFVKPGTRRICLNRSCRTATGLDSIRYPVLWQFKDHIPFALHHQSNYLRQSTFKPQWLQTYLIRLVSTITSEAAPKMRIGRRFD
jgi:hypothetical protein